VFTARQSLDGTWQSNGLLAALSNTSVLALAEESGDLVNASSSLASVVSSGLAIININLAVISGETLQADTSWGVGLINDALAVVGAMVSGAGRWVITLWHTVVPLLVEVGSGGA